MEKKKAAAGGSRKFALEQRGKTVWKNLIMSAAAISQLMTREEWDELSFRLKGLPRGH